MPEDLVGLVFLVGYFSLCSMVNPQSSIVCDELLPLYEIVVHVLGNGEQRDSPGALRKLYTRRSDYMSIAGARVRVSFFGSIQSSIEMCTHDKYCNSAGCAACEA